MKEKELNFQVSGMLWQRSLIMRDPETKTLWSHLLGKGMRGPLEGFELERIPAVITTWTDWKTRHPESSVLAMERTAERFDSKQWEKARRLVFGVLGGEKGESPAVGIRRLQKEGVLVLKQPAPGIVFTHLSDGGSVQAFRSEVQGKPALFKAVDGGLMKDKATESSWSRDEGIAVSGPLEGRRLVPVPGTLSYEEAWKKFYPDSRIEQ